VAGKPRCDDQVRDLRKRSNDCVVVCAVKGGVFQWVKGPPGNSLQPEATGAVMEATKWLKPSV
jgi:hypothetical protein